MKAKITELIAALRRDEVAVSVAEAIDAARAAAMAGVERSVLRDALAAALVKDERDRPVFLAAFEAVFPARAADVTVVPGRKRGRRSAGSGGDAGGGARVAGAPTGSSTSGSGAAATDAPRADAQRSGAPQGLAQAMAQTVAQAMANDDDGPAGASPPTASASRSGEPADDHTETGAAPAGDAAADGDPDPEGVGLDRARALRERRLQRLPFRAMTPTDVEACAALVRAIAQRVTARVRRRLAPRKTGRLDFRRTMRAAVPHGGVPFERRHRGRRPGAPVLVALCDLSASTAIATEFFLALLAPAAPYFRQVRFFGFVDRLVEIEFAEGQVRPAAAIDLMARSDFGRVLKDLVAEPAAMLGADTVLLVLGDARNNRRPPRADLLAAARARVRRLLWLNPDPRERWNTGDSVIATYAPHADAVVACGTLAELEQALVAVAKL